MKRRWLPVAVVCVAIAAGGSPAGAQSSAARQVQFTLRTLTGDSLRLGPREPATLVAVFATWCRSCKEEVATLNQLQRELTPQHVRVVAVNVDKATEEPVKHWLDGLGATYPAALDESGNIGRALGAVGVPEFYLVSAEGRVQFTRRGPIASMLPALRKAVAQLGASPP